MWKQVSVLLLLICWCMENTEIEALDCKSQCLSCKNAVLEHCAPGSIIASDGCGCCDICVLESGYGGQCNTTASGLTLDGKLNNAGNKAQCQPGLDCLGGVCVSLCKRSFMQHPHEFHCDQMGNRLLVRCATRNCWCVNSRSDRKILDTMVPMPITYERITFCTSLKTMTIVPNYWFHQVSQHYTPKKENENCLVRAEVGDPQTGLKDVTGSQRPIAAVKARYPREIVIIPSQKNQRNDEFQHSFGNNLYTHFKRGLENLSINEKPWLEKAAEKCTANSPAKYMLHRHVGYKVDPVMKTGHRPMVYEVSKEVPLSSTETGKNSD